MRPTVDEKQNRQSWQVPNATFGNAEKNKISDENEGWQRHNGRKRDLSVKPGWQ